MKRGLRNSALEHADRGWHVLPLRPRSKAPLGQLVPNGLKNASADLAQVFRWWERAPAANVGLVCGPSGLVVLDVDPRNGGDDSLHELERQLGPLPATPRALTGGGGEHYFFRHPRVPLRPVLADGLDLKDHGYVLLAPSVHPNGRRYEWDLTPDDVPLADLPAAWLDRARQPEHLARRDGLTVNERTDDPLRRVPADVYVPRLTGRTPDRDGWLPCPFHGGGDEESPSFQVKGTVWSCFGGCDPFPGQVVRGGNVYTLAALVWGYPVPLRGVDFQEAAGRLTRELLP